MCGPQTALACTVPLVSQRRPTENRGNPCARQWLNSRSPVSPGGRLRVFPDVCVCVGACVQGVHKGVMSARVVHLLGGTGPRDRGEPSTGAGMR